MLSLNRFLTDTFSVMADTPSNAMELYAYLKITAWNFPYLDEALEPLIKCIAYRYQRDEHKSQRWEEELLDTFYILTHGKPRDVSEEVTSETYRELVSAYINLSEGFSKHLLSLPMECQGMKIPGKKLTVANWLRDLNQEYVTNSGQLDWERYNDEGQSLVDLIRVTLDDAIDNSIKLQLRQSFDSWSTLLNYLDSQPLAPRKGTLVSEFYEALDLASSPQQFPVMPIDLEEYVQVNSLEWIDFYPWLVKCKEPAAVTVEENNEGS